MNNIKAPLVSVTNVTKVYGIGDDRKPWPWWAYVVLTLFSPFLITIPFLLYAIIRYLIFEGIRNARKQKTHSEQNGVVVIKNMNFEVAKGEIFAIVGESGSGKTTLLNMLGGVDSATKGEIVIAGNPIHSMSERALAEFRNEQLGYVFQFNNLLTEFNAFENVMLPSLIKRYDAKTAKAQAEALLTRVGLAHRMHHKVGELSGGEQQRVAIARALINNPSVILADEPTGNLDRKTAEEVQETLWNIVREMNMTLILVTHSKRVAAKADSIMRVALGAGEYVSVNEL